MDCCQLFEVGPAPGLAFSCPQESLQPEAEQLLCGVQRAIVGPSSVAVASAMVKLLTSISSLTLVRSLSMPLAYTDHKIDVTVAVRAGNSVGSASPPQVGRVPIRPGRRLQGQYPQTREDCCSCL